MCCDRISNNIKSKVKNTRVEKKQSRSKDSWAKGHRVCICLVAQSCPTLWGPIDCSLPDSSVQGISRQEFWSGLPSSPLRDLPDPGTESESSDS